MKIEIRSDSVVLDGYVNAVGRDSRPVITEHGKVVEQIEPRAFERALKRAENVDLLLNHIKERKLGSTKEKTLELFEDNIGLRAICTVRDEEVMRNAREGKLKGWSFGMLVEDDHLEPRAEGLPRRHVKELDLFEVSIINSAMQPVYDGTSIEQRADKEIICEQRTNEFRAVTSTVETPEEPINYTEFEKRLNKI